MEIEIGTVGIGCHPQVQIENHWKIPLRDRTF
jgi:hypothetical protein